MDAPFVVINTVRLREQLVQIELLYEAVAVLQLARPPRNLSEEKRTHP